MAKSALKKWYYSHNDVDGGISHGYKSGLEQLELAIKKLFVHRQRMMLWQRQTFNNQHMREDYGRFNFKIFSHPIRGAFYSDVQGTILWREWYQYVEYPSGARMLQSCDDPELVAVILEGAVVNRSKGVVTEKMREHFPGVFDEDTVIVPIEDVLRRKGHDI